MLVKLIAGFIFFHDLLRHFQRIIVGIKKVVASSLAHVVFHLLVLEGNLVANHLIFAYIVMILLTL